MVVPIFNLLVWRPPMNPRRLAPIALLASMPFLCAATSGPPLFDITRQCDANSRHNVTAMSECVVAESEARAQVLQNWSKYSEAGAERCTKLGRKAKRAPYAGMIKCLADEAAPAQPTAASTH